MSKIEHTATPWRVSDFERVNSGTGRMLMAEDGFAVAGVFERSVAENEVNARLIVSAVNSHEALKSALRSIRDHTDFDLTENCAGKASRLLEIEQIAEKALALAEEQAK